MINFNQTLLLNDTFRWALIKDKDVYERMSTYTDDNTFGVSRDSQLRALKLLKVVLEGDGRSIFKYAYETMRKRWEGLSQAVSLSTRFTIQEIAPRFCTFFQHVRGPSPGDSSIGSYALKNKMHNILMLHSIIMHRAMLGTPNYFSKMFPNS